MKDFILGSLEGRLIPLFHSFYEEAQYGSNMALSHKSKVATHPLRLYPKKLK